MPTNTFPHALAAFLPFQDAVACEAARNISRADFTKPQQEASNSTP